MTWCHGGCEGRGATGVPKLHDDEVEIDSTLVERLLAEQFPRWAGQPVQVIERSGTDNVTFRVGELSVRLPRTERTLGQVEKDVAWMPRLAPHVSLPIPEPLELGQPGAGYPFTWGIYRWLPGAPFVLAELDGVQAARDLAGFVRTLREVDATGAPVPDGDPFSRGTPLAPRDAMFREALDQLKDHFDTGWVTAAWEESLAADTWDGTPRWIHGDLMAGNVLVADGKLSAVSDFGTARAADPAGDLLAAWYLFEGDSRTGFREALEVDEAPWLRARGWALSLEIISIPYYLRRSPNALSEGQESVAEILTDFRL
ncbi:aminoglycoside phosphotransferase family protein [Kribbella sp. NPDC048928]|uniref:aminoglycoside phosphotransferase family protein n=1 Tax=Kribbella sp. NPDC048928 TaxID=3364111 RepID=UPI003719886E